MVFLVPDGLPPSHEARNFCMSSTGNKAASGICAAIDVTEGREAKMRVTEIRTFPPKLGFVFVPHSR